MSCRHRDPETGGCMRDNCFCNPPRCTCGRFVSEWGDMHPGCREAMLAEISMQERYDFEAGLP